MVVHYYGNEGKSRRTDGRRIESFIYTAHSIEPTNGTVLEICTFPKISSKLSGEVTVGTLTVTSTAVCMVVHYDGNSVRSRSCCRFHEKLATATCAAQLFSFLRSQRPLCERLMTSPMWYVPTNCLPLCMKHCGNPGKEVPHP
jgi:hypothetical protein